MYLGCENRCWISFENVWFNKLWIWYMGLLVCGWRGILVINIWKFNIKEENVRCMFIDNLGWFKLNN